MFAIFQEETCCICQERMESSLYRAELPCGHTFCFGCYRTWGRTCPMCRRERDVVPVCSLCRDELDQRATNGAWNGDLFHEGCMRYVMDYGLEVPELPCHPSVGVRSRVRLILEADDLRIRNQRQQQPPPPPSPPPTAEEEGSLHEPEVPEDDSMSAAEEATEDSDYLPDPTPLPEPTHPYFLRSTARRQQRMDESLADALMDESARSPFSNHSEGDEIPSFRPFEVTLLSSSDESLPSLSDLLGRSATEEAGDSALPPPPPSPPPPENCEVESSLPSSLSSDDSSILCLGENPLPDDDEESSSPPPTSSPPPPPRPRPREYSCPVCKEMDTTEGSQAM